MASPPSFPHLHPHPLPHPWPSPNPSLFPFLAPLAPTIPSFSPNPFLFAPPFPSFSCPPYPFCYPPILPNSAPPSHPSPSQPNKHHLTKPPPLTMITLPKFTTKLASSLSDHGARKVLFELMQNFSFSFDSGRPNSYAIHESRGNVNGLFGSLKKEGE